MSRTCPRAVRGTDRDTPLKGCPLSPCQDSNKATDGFQIRARDSWMLYYNIDA